MKANPRSEIGWVIEERRNELGITLLELARRSGVHRTVTARLYANRDRYASPQTLQRLADALEFEVDTLYAAMKRDLREVPAPYRPPNTGGGALAGLLAEKRRERGWSIEQLAEHAGLQPSSVGYLARGRTRVPRLATLHALAAALQVDVQELVDAMLTDQRRSR